MMHWGAWRKGLLRRTGGRAACPKLPARVQRVAVGRYVMDMLLTT